MLIERTQLAVPPALPTRQRSIFGDWEEGKNRDQFRTQILSIWQSEFIETENIDDSFFWT
ncbi:MAG: hypothetical protein Q27BB25_06390 [Blastomonas sp. CACIA14H2]|nr:MAG: hypothetical protein Q27BB25_06390 [Blastomonas sp. CACIA14H2]